MNQNNPIKRHAVLINLSREHHGGLLLCWKINTGFSKAIAVDRIKAYTDFFYHHSLLPHFEFEERSIFPLLPPQNAHYQKALADHARLRFLFEDKTDVVNSLHFIAKELNDHIRFEERTLFNALQLSVPENKLQELLELHDEPIKEADWADKFWE